MKLYSMKLNVKTSLFSRSGIFYALLHINIAVATAEAVGLSALNNISLLTKLGKECISINVKC